MTRVLIVRHGNTFQPGDTILRVGRRTNIPLSNSGREQARQLGAHLSRQYRTLDAVFSGTLHRTVETAALIVDAFASPVPTHASEQFDEIDYGPDEGKAEADVIARIGAPALNAWNEHGIAPDGWLVDPAALRLMWRTFLEQTVVERGGQTTVVVTSNGVARFAAALLANRDEFLSRVSLKLRTCGYWELVADDALGDWHGQAPMLAVADTLGDQGCTSRHSRIVTPS